MNDKKGIHLERIGSEEFEVLYAVGFWNLTTLDYISGISDELGVSVDSVNKILRYLEKKKLLIVLMRDEKVYSAKLTENGNLLFHDTYYQGIKEELGC